MAFQIMSRVGRVCADYCEKNIGLANWNTWPFLGLSGRSPIYPFRKKPYYQDYEEIIECRRYDKHMENELFTVYRNLIFQGHVHPQREQCDYAVISDAEHRQDIG